MVTSSRGVNEPRTTNTNASAAHAAEATHARRRRTGEDLRTTEYREKITDHQGAIERLGDEFAAKSIGAVFRGCQRPRCAASRAGNAAPIIRAEASPCGAAPRPDGTVPQGFRPL